MCVHLIKFVPVNVYVVSLSLSLSPCRTLVGEGEIHFRFNEVPLVVAAVGSLSAQIKCILMNGRCVCPNFRCDAKYGFLVLQFDSLFICSFICSGGALKAKHHSHADINVNVSAE